jgi:hypothetical protein
MYCRNCRLQVPLAALWLLVLVLVAVVPVVWVLVVLLLTPMARVPNQFWDLALSDHNC